MSLDVIECITWLLIVLSSRNSDNKRRKWVCCAVQSSQLFRAAGTGFICCYSSGLWKQKPQPLQPFLRPGPNPLHPINANDVAKSRVWGLFCYIKTSHPREKLPIAFLHPWTKSDSPGKGVCSSANMRLPLSSWELEPEGNSLSAGEWSICRNCFFTLLPYIWRRIMQFLSLR